jgi:hypothetical protein
MSLEDAIGSGPDFTADSVLDRVSRSVLPDLPENVNADAVLNRLNRKLSLTKPAEEDKPEKPEKAGKPDFSSEGTPVGDLPDLSSYGTPADAVPLPQPRPAGAPQSPLGVTGQLAAAGKQVGRSALGGVGGIVQGMGTPAPPISPAVQTAAAGEDPANQWALPGTPTDPEIVPPAAPPNAAQRGLIQAGKGITEFGTSHIPMTKQEEESGGAAVGGVVGGVLPYMAGALIPGAEGPTVLAGAAGMGLTSAGQTYQAAKEKGASDADAAEAAGLSGVVGGALGALPLSAVMRPITQNAPGLAGYAVAKLAQAAQSGVTFATVGEAQEYLGEQIAKEYYDKDAGYAKNFTIKRLIAELAGGILGMFHPLHKGETPPEAPAAEAPQPDAQARAPAEGLPPPGEEQPAGAQSTDAPPPGPDTGPQPGAAGPQPGPDTGGPGAAEQPRAQQAPPPGAEAPQPEAEPTRGAKTEDFSMDPKTRAKMEKVFRQFEPGTDPSKMSDADLFNALQEHLRDTSSTGYTAKPETADEAAAREEAATARIEREGLIRKGWDPAWVDAMTPQQRRQKYQEAMAGSTEQPKAPPTSKPDVGAPESLPSIFTTAKGSTYQVHEDGTTTRNKAARSDVGHEGDSGLKERSAKTVYLDKQALNAFAIPQDTRWRAIDHGDGTMSLATWNDARKDWGISPGSRNIPYSNKPAVGLHPLEVWKPETIKGLTAYKGMHPGNAITAIGPVNPAAGAREAPIRPVTADDVVKAQAAEPTPAQADASNYRHAHMDLPQFGLTGRRNISIETGVGQTRRGIGPDGKPWEVTLKHGAYGGIKGVAGNDGQDLDIFVGPHPASPHIFIVNQHDPVTGKWDEHKILAGYRTPIDALHNYVNSFTDKAKGRIGGMVAMTPDQFKVWLDTADKTKPVEHQSGKDVAWVKRNTRIPDQQSLQRSGAETDEAEIIAEHTRAIETALGPDAERVAQVDIRRAAELMADHPDMDVAAAFGRAVIENAVRQKFLTSSEAVKAYGPEVTQILVAGREGAGLFGDGHKQGDLMDAMREVPKGKIEDFGEKIGGARKDTAVSTGERGATPKAIDERPTWAKRFDIVQDMKSGRWLVRDNRTDKPVNDSRSRWTALTFETKEEAEKMLPLLAVAQKHRVVRESSKDGSGYKIIRDVTDKKRVTIKDGFETDHDAMQYLHDHAKEILETKTGFGEEILATPEKVTREGEKRREGDVKERDFSDTFGFRGVEFGNWNNQAERQEVMNHAFDALHDLAALLNVPPKALSLNGELAIAFGARGHGLSGARAHYERDYGTINLTKMSGAGTLAHEWMHAFDHYLARLDTKAKPERVANAEGHKVFEAGGPGTDYITHGPSYKSKLRDELKAALKEVNDTIATKAENYVEDTQNADKWLGTAKKRLGDQLDAIRKNIAEEQQYGSKKKPANAEQLGRFDALADKLRNGDDISTKWKVIESKTKSIKSRWSNDTIDALSDLYKEVRGRTGFTDNGGPMNDLVYRVQDFAKRAKMMEDAAAQSVKTKKVPTQFMRDAYNLDQGRSSDYWGTPHELAARAMSSYVEDKIAEQGGRSDFLSYGSDNAFYRIFNQRPFPEGAEREAINAALDKLFKTIKTVETDRGIGFAEPTNPFGRGGGLEKLLPPEQRAPIEAAVSELMKRLLGDHVKVHFQNGLIGLGEHAKARWGELGENAKAKGMYYPYRHIIRLALTDGIDETAFHEAYHASEYQLQTPQERALMERETPAIRKWIAKKRGYSDAQVDGMAPEEVRAVGAEEYMKDRMEGVENPGAGLHIGVRRWWQRLWDAFRALANKLRGMGFKTYNDIYGDLYEGKHADRSGDTPRREADRRKEEIHEEDLARPDDALASIFEKRTAANNRVSNKIANLFSDSKRADMHEVLADYSYREKLLQKELEARYLGLTPEEAAKIFPEASKLPDAMQFYIKKGLISGKIVDDSNKFKKQYLDPLVKAANDARISREDIGDYLLAKGALERNRNIAKMYKPGHPFNDAMRDNTIAGGSGFSNKEASDKIKEYETGPKADAFKDIWKRSRDIVNFNREMMVHFGLETRDTIEEWKRNGKDYIPYSGFEETPEENPEEYFGGSKYSALGIKGPETERAFGRKSKADNPLVHLIDQTYRTIERGERNSHYNSIWDAFATLEKNGVNIKDIVSVNKGTPQKTIDAKTGLVKMTDGGRGAQEKGAVNFKRNGIPRTMVFKSEKLAQSILRNSPWTFWGLRHMLLGINKLKSLWTHYSPDFAARHFLGRYMIEGVLNAQQLKDTGKFSSAKWIADAIPQIGRASRAIAKRNKGDDAGQLGKYWDEMQSHGGQMAFRQMRDINNIKNELTRDLRDLTGKAHLNPLQILHRITSRIDEIFNTWDNATRLATYAQARDQGMTPQASAHRSLNATVNYQKAGLVANVAGVVFPFFKVSVNTGTRMFGAMQQSNRMRRVFAGVFFAGVGLALVNYLLGGNDEDGTPFFEKVPPWERALGAVFINPLDKDAKGRPQKYVDPMPYNYAMPMTWGYHLTGMLLSKLGYIKSSISTSEHITDMIKSAAMAFTPFGETGNLTDMITPELLKPLVHVANNKDWKGSSIHNDGQFQKGPASENGRDSTGEGWKAAAKGLNSLTGGTPYSSGLLDAYPESIRELADQMFGSQKRFGMEVGASAESISNSEAPKPTETPIARVFRGIDYDQADLAAYSKARREAKDEKGAIDKARKDIRSGINVEEAQQFIQDHPEAQTESKIFDRAAKQMGRLRKEQVTINNSSADDNEKKAALDDIRQRMMDVQNRARAESRRLKEGNSPEPSANVPPSGPSINNGRSLHQHPNT